MLRGRRFRVDPAKVVHETIEGETILINLETGTYYSLRGAGPEIWGSLVAGRSAADVVAELQHRYPAAESATVSDATERLIEQMLEEGLLADGEPRENSAPAEAGAAESKAMFEPPKLERYTDMQYFLLLDPIHEVHDGGWPQAPAARAAGA